MYNQRVAEEDEDLEAYWADVRPPQAPRACSHPGGSRYGDPEFGTTFCGVCHADITKLRDQELRDQKAKAIPVIPTENWTLLDEV